MSLVISEQDDNSATVKFKTSIYQKYYKGKKRQAQTGKRIFNTKTDKVFL